jgi:lysine-specific demethylase 3
MVPASAYTRRDGALNLISHFPKNTIAPDVGESANLQDIHICDTGPGPKMYNALATEERPGTLGTTKLHMDMADAVNIMVHAESRGDEEGYAIWDIYRAEDSEHIREYLKKFPNPLVMKVLPDGSSPDQDPIHTQSFYLDPIKRKELYQEFGIYSHRIYQRPGQAVFIPAGCAHQVRIPAYLLG